MGGVRKGPRKGEGMRIEEIRIRSELTWIKLKQPDQTSN